MKTYMLAAWLLISRGVRRTAKALILLPVGPYLLAKSELAGWRNGNYDTSMVAVLLGFTSLILSIPYAIFFNLDHMTRVPDVIGIPAVVCLGQYVLAGAAHLLTPVWRNTIEEAVQMQGINSPEDEKSVLLRVVGE